MHGIPSNFGHIVSEFTIGVNSILSLAATGSGKAFTIFGTSFGRAGLLARARALLG